MINSENGSMELQFKCFIISWKIGGFGPKSRPVLIYKTITVNAKQMLMNLWLLFFFLKVCTWVMKKHQLKILRVTIILPFFKILKKTPGFTIRLKMKSQS